MCTTIFPFPSSRLRALSPSPPHPIHQAQPSPNLKISLPFLLPTRAATDKGANSVSTFNDEKKVLETGKKIPEVTGSLGPSGLEGVVKMATKFDDSRWVNGTWDLKRFQKNNTTDWDAVIDAEVRRRKWFEDNPESSRVEDHVVFNTSVVPWWAWVKRFHLPEAERLNGRAAMLGFFMAYLVDSLTGIGLVDQTNNFVCKTLLFIVVLGVLLIRNNDDVENLKKFLQETTSYDKQWQATWKDKTPSSSNNE